MFLAIDRRPLIRQPHLIEVAPYQHSQMFTADQRPMVTPGSRYVTVNCTWGRNLSHEDVLDELRRLKATTGIHSITFEPLRGQRYITINAYMGDTREAHMGYTTRGSIASSSFTIPFIQVDPTVFLFPLELNLRDIIAVISPFCFHTAPVAGRIFQADGFIEDLGAGGGQTRVEVTNDDRAISYMTTPGDFVCAAPANHQMQNHVLASDLDFYKDDRIDADVLTIPGGGMSRSAIITLWCWGFYP